jgi:hypothetical protein
MSEPDREATAIEQMEGGNEGKGAQVQGARLFAQRALV